MTNWPPKKCCTWHRANASLTAVPTYITYYDQKEVARVVGRESVPVLDSKLLPAR